MYQCFHIVTCKTTDLNTPKTLTESGAPRLRGTSFDALRARRGCCRPFFVPNRNLPTDYLWRRSPVFLVPCRKTLSSTKEWCTRYGMNRIALGVLCGVAFGLIDVLMTVFGNHPDRTTGLLLQASSLSAS